MSDKVQLIKEEIESYKESMKGLEPHSDFRRGQITAYNQIMQFIDSLPEEPASEDLDFLVISLEETIGTSPHSREVIKEHLQKAAEWQKQQMMKNAVKAEVFTDYNINFGYGSLISIIDLDEQHLKEGDKVKIIIVKED